MVLAAALAAAACRAPAAQPVAPSRLDQGRMLGAVAVLAATGCKPLGNTYSGCVSSADCTLAADGWRVVEPGAGRLACGVEGKGRMAEPEAIVAFLQEVLG